MVTYGGVSGNPLTINTADFIFRNLKVAGFWINHWRKDNPAKYTETIHALCSLIGENKFKPPRCEEFSLRAYEVAFKKYQTPQLNSKILFTQ